MTLGEFEHFMNIKVGPDHQALRYRHTVSTPKTFTLRLQSRLLLPHLFWCRDAHVSAPSQHPVRARLVLLPASGLERAGLRRRLPVAAD